MGEGVETWGGKYNNYKCTQFRMEIYTGECTYTFGRQVEAEIFKHVVRAFCEQLWTQMCSDKNFRGIACEKKTTLYTEWSFTLLHLGIGNTREILSIHT